MAKYLDKDGLTYYHESLMDSIATDYEKKAAAVTVYGQSPSIVGVANTRYICGEVLNLSITPPQNGIIDVTFTSGSTPTVLTLPSTVKMPEWFEVEAGYIYEISIQDGVYGVVMSWPI